MKKIVRLTESDLIRLVKKVIKEQIDPNAWKSSPKAQNTKKFQQVFNKIYKTNFPIDGNWKDPKYNETMKRYITDKKLTVYVCEKGDGYCHDEDAGEVTVKDDDIRKLFDYVNVDLTGSMESTGPKDVRKFQDWLDQNKPNWIRGGKLNKGKGYGTFGPYTKKAWSMYKSEYKEN